MPNAKCKRCQQGLPHEFKHGLNGYGYHACRCEICASSHREAMRSKTARGCVRCLAGEDHNFKHGASGYAYHKCRCETCRSAASTARLVAYRNDVEEARQKARDHYWKDPDRSRRVSREWREKNRARIERQRRERRANRTDDQIEAERARCKAYREANRERLKEVAAARASRHTEHRRAYNRKYRAKYDRLTITRSGDFTPAEDLIVLDAGISMIERAAKLGRHPDDIRVRLTRLRQAPVECERCGNEFLPAPKGARGLTRYCSHSCRSRHMWEKVPRPTECTVQGCDIPLDRGHGRGLCYKHYANWRRCGNPLGLPKESAQEIIYKGKRLSSLRATTQRGEWDRVLEDEGLSSPTASRLMSIGRNPALSANLDAMPSLLHALYELSQMSPEAVVRGIARGEITPTITCADAKALRAANPR